MQIVKIKMIGEIIKNQKIIKNQNWRDYKEPEEISIRLLDTDNERNDSEIFPRKRKHAR